MALDMRALYYVALPTERSEADDVQRHEEDIKANENCLNQNFSALAQKIYEFEARIALLEAVNELSHVGLVRLPEKRHVSHQKLV